MKEYKLSEKAVRSSTLRMRYKMYWQGHEVGYAKASKLAHLDGISYRELVELIQIKGRITFRHNIYPMVLLTLSTIDSDMYFLKSIAEKIRWSRLQPWSKSMEIILVWEGQNAQALLTKCWRYLSADQKILAKKALTWIPSKGVKLTEKDIVPPPESLTKAYNLAQENIPNG